jgi:hypothetical protein
LNGTLTWKGSYFSQSLSDGYELLCGNTDILIRGLGNVIFGKILKETLEGSNNSVTDGKKFSSANLIYVTPPCSNRDRSSNFLSIFSMSKASQEFTTRDLAHSILVRSSREA